ncbi:MAG: choice-of-anchor B family protein [Bacteroidetes bacterium]|nr:choice-of-anchor B family protein [Bacteroidota bacterium]
MKIHGMRKILLTALLISVFFVSGWAQTNFNIQYRSQLPYGAAVELSNIWGYVDSLGNEYALVGAQNGLSIVDVTNPTNPIVKFTVAGTNSFWREVQVHGKYAYVTTEGCCNGLQIVNLSNLPASVSSKYWTGSGVIAGTLGRIHSLHIRDSYLYLNGSQLFGGAALIVSLADPWNPVYLSNTSAGFSGNARYIHDCYVKNDTLWGANIYGGYFSVFNVSNKSNPVFIDAEYTPNNFTHNTWMADNGSSILFTTDEVSNSYLAAYDVSNTSNIVYLDKLQGNPGSGSIIHNTYIRNNFAISSYYKDGVTIVDVSRPKNMITVGKYDTYTQGSGNGFNGAWGVHPFLPSGNLIVSDINNGLFVLTPTYIRACYLEGLVSDSCSGLPLSNVSVVITGGTHHNELSLLNGEYRTGTATAGSFTVTFSKAGYTSKVFTNVALQNGVLNAMNVQLRPTNAVNIASSSTVNPLCNAAATGSINITTANGTLPLSYQWSNGATTEDLINVMEGTYTVSVTDGLGCVSERTSTLIAPPAITAVQTVVPVSCNQAQDGVIGVNVNGGVGPYSYQWTYQPFPPMANIGVAKVKLSTVKKKFVLSSLSMVPDSTGIDSLIAGIYQLQITDNNGCVKTSSYSMLDPLNPCSVTISLRLFVEGFYTGSNTMTPVVNSTLQLTDTIHFELRDPNAPYAVQHTATGVVNSSGYIDFVFPPSLWQQSYYMVVKHRNSIETWSKTPFYIPQGIQSFSLTESLVPITNPDNYITE